MRLVRFGCSVPLVIATVVLQPALPAHAQGIDLWNPPTSTAGMTTPQTLGFWSPTVDIRSDITTFLMSPVHAVLLADGTPKGKLLVYRNNEIKVFNLNTNGDMWTFDLRNGTPSASGFTHEAFCTGHVFLPDGRLLVVGGRQEYKCLQPSTCQDPAPHPTCCWDAAAGECGGPPVEDGWASIYDPFADADGTDPDVWDQTVPDMPEDSGMPIPPSTTTPRNPNRYYPTLTVQPDGTVLITSGNFWTDLDDDCDVTGGDSGGETTQQLRWLTYDPSAPTAPYTLGWYTYGASFEYTPVDADAPGDKAMQLYPHVKAVPQGLLWTGKDVNNPVANPPGTDTRLWSWTNPSGNPIRVTRHLAGDEAESNRDSGAAVLLTLTPGGDVDLLHLGGGLTNGSNFPHNSASLITIQWTPSGAGGLTSWRWAGQNSGQMASTDARRRPDAVILPDGKVLIAGGEYKTDVGGVVEEHNPNLECELYDPESDTFTLVDTLGDSRRYHSQALLLPDASVFMSGDEGDSPDNIGQDNSPNYEIFYPPYLFETDGSAFADRPVIDTDVVTVEYGFGFTFAVDHENAAKDANDIEEVMLLAPSAVTHSNNMTQRRILLDFEVVANGDSIHATGPVDESYAPPGPYMLFLLGKADAGAAVPEVPSEADFVMLQRGNYTVATGQTAEWRGTVYLDQDFVVAAGGTLVIRPGTDVVSLPGKGVEIQVAGELQADGTAQDRINFRVLELGAPAAAGSWDGIRFVNDVSDLSVSSVKNADIDAAFYAIKVDSVSGNIFDCNFTNSAAADIYLDHDTRVVEGHEWKLLAPTEVIALAESQGGDVEDLGVDPDRVEIVVNGRLTTSDPTTSGERVKFVATTSDAFAGKAWYGVSVEGTGWDGDGIGVGRIADAYFDSAVYPLSFLAADTAEVVDSHFFRYEQTAITDWASDAEIMRNAVVRDLQSTFPGSARAGRVGIHVASSFARVESDTVFYNTDKGIWIEGTYGDCLAAPYGAEQAIVVRDNQVIQDNPVVPAVEESGVVIRWICHERDVVMESNNIYGWRGRGVVLDQVSDVHLECNCITENEYGVLHQRKYVPIDPVWDGVNTFLQNNVARNTIVNVQAKTAPTGTTDGGLRFGEQSSTSSGGNRTQMGDVGTLHYQIRSFELNRTDYAEDGEWFDQASALMTQSTTPTILDQIDVFGTTQAVSITGFVAAAVDSFGATGPPLCSTGALCTVPSRPAGGGSRTAAGPGTAVSDASPAEARSGVLPQDAIIGLSEGFTWGLERLVPNPTGSGTSVTFTVPPAPDPVRIAVYDVAGRRVASLHDGPVEPGRHVISWGGRDNSGRRVGSGVFFVRMVAGGFTETRKLTVLSR